MDAKDCKRRALRYLAAVAVACRSVPRSLRPSSRDVRSSAPVTPRRSLRRVAPARPQTGAAAAMPARLDQMDVPPAQLTRIPVNPTDPIAIVNGEVISRQQLADECVARRGKEVLDTLINRTLIEQALKRNHQEVTAAEIEQEIENVAQRFGIGRKAWLQTLDKERGISPAQYAREIIYPALALRKLSTGRVTVTEKDMQDAFESQYGDKLRCRMIMVDKLFKAQDIWERLKKNPGGFEKLAQEESIDPGSRSLGGQLGEPITRHAYPPNVSNAAFRQLVDGDPADKDPHKPKDGDFSGPIQAAEAVWVILRREAIIPAHPTASLKDERIKKQTYEMIYEVKLKETMGMIFQELTRAAEIQNNLVGNVKMANEEQQEEFNSVDKNSVKLMKTPGGASGPLHENATRAAAARRVRADQDTAAGRGLPRGHPATRKLSEASPEGL